MECTILQGFDKQTVPFTPPKKLSELIMEAGLSFPMPCGQNGTCGKCAVQVTGKLSPIEESERKKLIGAPDGIRLACCTYALGDCTITLPEKQYRIVSDSDLLHTALDPMAKGYGFAVDIGTTTVAIYLYDLNAGKCLEKHTFMNPQGSFGADVISRIEKASSGKQKELGEIIRNAVEHSILSMSQKHALTPSAAVITGNTSMLYLFLEQDTTPMTAAPFEISEYLGKAITGIFPRFPKLSCYFPRTIAAFVGSDITCSLLACGMYDTDQTVLMADIGTNGEMGLLHQGKLYVCATAAGPAFEGAGITFGMAASEGAIDSVSVTGEQITHTVIDAKKATGICGTGLIDAVAVLYRTGLMDETGYIEEENDRFEAYLTEYDDETAVKLTKEICITQRDVRQLQLAKAAICGGIDTLLLTAGITPEEVDTFYIAGGFGRYIDTASASAIGLFPRELAAHAKAVGNAAGAGACMLLCNRNLFKQSDALAKSAEVVDLSTSAVFMERYIERMHFANEEDE